MLFGRYAQCQRTGRPSSGFHFVADRETTKSGLLYDCLAAACSDLAFSNSTARRCILLCYFSRLTSSAAAAPGTRIVVECLPPAMKAEADIIKRPRIASWSDCSVGNCDNVIATADQQKQTTRALILPLQLFDATC